MAAFLALKWRRCVEALFEPSARKIVEIVAKAEAPEKSSYLLTWPEPGDFGSSALKRLIAGSAAIIVLVLLLENWVHAGTAFAPIPL